ncbi:hypothetical protein [Chamaesiphon sp. VAR_69_metabat_338]|uniref:hypothetical protein n=1 Tax=Chamaesiphon sp. VAR_69_metabat_338 TaxID=2964704 RepID=UPI00286E72ED|nr:hypothetical protein [Chamaesiphon sp. VAR_69_metabat_338]
MNKWNYPVALCSIVCLCSCQPQPDRLLNQKIDSQIQQGKKEVRIAEITDFVWDKMYIFAPYTAPAQVDRALGFEWQEYKSLGIESKDTDDLLVFVAHKMGDGRVVKFTKCQRSFGNFRFSQATNGYGYSPVQAVFAVSVKAQNKLLLAINEPKQNTFSVTDIIPEQPGIYNIEAWFLFTHPDRLTIKVFNTKTNQPVMMKYTKPQFPSTPDGWSERGTTLFPYRSQIMIQEGGWDRQYATRWELWQQQPNGTEQKLMETTRMVNGWER